MTLPAQWILVPVTGTFLTTDGAPAQGAIVFTSSQPLVVDGVTVFPTAFIARLDANGTFRIELPATDDPHLSNRDWTFHVREVIPGGRCYDVAIPYGSGGIDLAAVAPVVAPTVAVGLAAVARTGNAADLVGLQELIDAALASGGGGGAVARQAANTMLAGPLMGDPALPNYRHIDADDLNGVVIDGGNF